MELFVYCLGASGRTYEFMGAFEGNQMDAILASAPVAQAVGEGTHDVFAAWGHRTGWAKRFTVEVPSPAPAARVTEVIA
jgi:hypothetical protein